MRVYFVSFLIFLSAPVASFNPQRKPNVLFLFEILPIPGAMTILAKLLLFLVKKCVLRKVVDSTKISRIPGNSGRRVFVLQI